MSFSSFSSCRPPRGTTYLTIGQDLFSIQQYLTEQYNASLHRGSLLPIATFAPAAVMAYTDLQTLRGLWAPVDYGSGMEYSDGILQSLFPNQAVGLQLGLWLNGTEGCQQVNDGTLDDKINQLMQYLKDCKAPQIFLRVGYEFDNPSFGYSSNPKAYIQAFRRLVQTCDDAQLDDDHWACRDKVKFVWHSWAAPRQVPLQDFYPGDDAVDWIGVSIFSQVYPWSSEHTTGTVRQVEEVLDFAVRHDKPTMIAESTPFGGIVHWENTTLLQKYDLTDPWERWFRPVLDLMDRYDIGMWSYINCNWESQPMWHQAGFGETRLSTSKHVMEQWRRHVLQGQQRPFLHAGSLSDCVDLEEGMAPILGRSVSETKLVRKNPADNLVEPMLHHKIYAGVLAIVAVTLLGVYLILQQLRKVRKVWSGESLSIVHSSSNEHYSTMSMTNAVQQSSIME